MVSNMFNTLYNKAYKKHWNINFYSDIIHPFPPITWNYQNHFDNVNDTSVDFWWSFQYGFIQLMAFR